MLFFLFCFLSKIENYVKGVVSLFTSNLIAIVFRYKKWYEYKKIQRISLLYLCAITDTFWITIELLYLIWLNFDFKYCFWWTGYQCKVQPPENRPAPLDESWWCHANCEEIDSLACYYRCAGKGGQNSDLWYWKTVYCATIDWKEIYILVQ